MSGGFEVQPMERHENIARKRDLGIGQRKEPDKCLGRCKIPIQEDDDVRDESHVRSVRGGEPDCLIDLVQPEEES